MITQKDIQKIIANYNSDDIHIGALGGHSALDICNGAKKRGLKTVVVCQKGREKTYSDYYRNLVDELILVDKFKDIAKKEVQEKLRKLNTIFIHSRYFWVYCNFSEIENNFKIPIFGTRNLLRAEERAGKKNQYYLLKTAGIAYPKQFSNPKNIDRLVIVKASESARTYERAFFFASSYKEYLERSEGFIKHKQITKESLKNAIIEEFILGVQVNLNFFYSPLNQKLELIGTDTRRQTNLDGLLRLPAREQLEILTKIRPQYIESGHIACTLKESLLEKAFDIGEKFVAATKKEFPPGIIGPFALQAAVTPGPPKEEFVVFDISARIPGSPGIKATPYSEYLYGKPLSMGDRVAMEIKNAIGQNKLIDILT